VRRFLPYSLLILPIVSAFGALAQNRVTPYLTAGVVIVFLILVCLGKIKSHQRLVLYALSLSLLWGTSMLGPHIVGNDIHAELYAVRQAIDHGWDWRLHVPSNMSFVMGVLSPALAKIIDPVWQFKLLFPALFALVPVMLYDGYRRVFEDRVAVLGAAIVMIMPMFVLDMTSHVKGLVSQTFLVMVLWLLLRDDVSWKWRAVGIAAGVAGAAAAHYSTGAMMVIMLTGAGMVVAGWAVLHRLRGIASISRGVGRFVGSLTVPGANTPSKLKIWANPLILAALGAIIAMTAWLGVVGEASMLKTFLRVGNNIVNSDTTEQQAFYDHRTTPVEVTGTYLDKQEQVTRTALGLDFGEANGWGKLFRIAQFVTQIALVAGMIVMWKRRKAGQETYWALAISACVVLAMVILVPYLSTVTSTTRFYQILLLVVAPGMATGLIWLLRRKWALAAVVGAYVAFTLGVVFEASGQTELGRVNMPYSLALSNWRLGINGVHGENDRELAEWLSEKYWADKSTMVRSDYNGVKLLTEYMPSNATRLVPGSGYWLLVPEWEARNGKMIIARPPGLRFVEKLEDWVEVEGAVEVRREGDAVVYWVPLMEQPH
jgi:uncharacterized membrane protein